jgi:hypothetical protein
MNSFIKGMGSLNLFPRVKQRSESKPKTALDGLNEAFEAVGRDFEAVGRDMWKAIEDADRLYNTPKRPVGAH